MQFDRKNRPAIAQTVLIRIPLFFVLITACGVVADAQCNPVQVHKLLPNDGGVEHWFGRSLHLDGTIGIIASWDGEHAAGDGRLTSSIWSQGNN